MNPSTRHPLLVLSPQARRQLARTLVQGLVVTRKQELRSRTREGLIGGAVYGAVGAAGLAAWTVATGGAAAPFLAFYGLWGGVQAAFAAGLARQGIKAPLGPLVNGPLSLGQAVTAWVAPRRLTPDRLVLAAGILVAVRRPVSRRLLTRLYGRAFPQGEVDHAIDLLSHLGFITSGEGLLHLSPDGFQLLKNLGVPAPTARPRQDPHVAPHIMPLFAALDGRTRRLPPEPEPTFQPPAAPVVELPTFAPPQHVYPEAAFAPPPVFVPEPPVAEPEPVIAAPDPVVDEPPAVVEAPEVVPEVEAPVMEALVPEVPAFEAPIVEEAPPEPVFEPFPTFAELPIATAPPPAVDALDLDVPDYDDIDLGPETGDLLPPRRRLGWRRPAAAAAAVLLAGLLVFVLLDEPLNPLRHTSEVVATAAHMPGPSRGVALQFNGRGKMLSSFGGGLYLSVPERMDYKTPMDFKDFDMSSSCGLVSREVERASLSPTGRFLWTEMGGGQGGPRERCLVDLETKTVSHDLVARNATYGLPGVIGWAGDQQLLMSEEVQPGQAAHWWLMDVATHQPKALQLPSHGRLLPLATESGMTMLAGWDMRKLGSWDLTIYRLDEHQAYQAIKTVHTTLPETMREAEPRLAAISPDRRFLLATLKPVGVEVPAQAGTLAVVALDDGGASAVTTAVPPLPDQPIFWAPEVQNGNYRFYFNGGGPDGVVPCAGEMRPG
ncbi:MAG: hypothetical protein JWM80_5749 [Cyanobacteria bacterium RYN_339]|nr:hypothetical protein [Cyanobacteria bacterium RYN_339]